MDYSSSVTAPGTLDIVEVVECNAQKSNKYLQQGYKLLEVRQVARHKIAPDGAFYIAQYPVYILGKTAEEQTDAGNRS